MDGYTILGIVLLLVGAAGAGFVFGHAAGVFDERRNQLRTEGWYREQFQRSTIEYPQRDTYPDELTRSKP